MSAVEKLEAVASDFVALRKLCIEVLLHANQIGVFSEFSTVEDSYMLKAEDDVENFTLPNTKGHYKTTATESDIARSAGSGSGMSAVLAASGVVVAPFLLPKPNFMTLTLAAPAPAAPAIGVGNSNSASASGSGSVSSNAATSPNKQKSLRKQVTKLLGMAKKSKKTKNGDGVSDSGSCDVSGSDVLVLHARCKFLWSREPLSLFLSQAFAYTVLMVILHYLLMCAVTVVFQTLIQKLLKTQQQPATNVQNP